MVLLFIRCGDLDFSERSVPTSVPPPPNEGLGWATFNTTLQVTQLSCSASAVYRFNGISGVMGVLTIHTYPQPGNGPNCALIVRIQRMNGTDPSPGPAPSDFTRAIVPGESMSDVLDLNGVTNIMVQMDCLGEGTACLFDPPELKVGIADLSNPLRMPFAQTHSNPLAARNYTLKPGGNNCQTEEVDLHKIYLDYSASNNIKIRVVAVNMCDCNPYVVKTYHNFHRNKWTIKDSRAEAMKHGKEIKIEDIKAGQTMIRVTGSCAGANLNTTCLGDALVYITSK